jgi:hypothetical protein
MCINLQRTFYEIKYAAFSFWSELLVAFKAMGFKSSAVQALPYISKL